MVISADAVIGLVGVVVLGLLGFLAARSLAAIDGNIKGLRAFRHECRNYLSELKLKQTVHEERINRIVDELEELERVVAAWTNSKGSH